MRHWVKLVFAAVSPLLLSSCLWGPGKFKSDLTLHRDGSFVLDYRGEIMLQLPDETPRTITWSDSSAICYAGLDGTKRPAPPPIAPPAPPPMIKPSASPPQTVDIQNPRPPIIVSTPVVPPVAGAKRPSAPSMRWPGQRSCTKAEIASQRMAFERREADRVQRARKQQEDLAKLFGLPGLDDQSSRDFAKKLTKYAGWRSVTYRGKGVYEVDYHFVGSARQDFLFPALPDNDLLVPFIALRRRADGSVLVTAPAFTGGAGPLMARAAAMGGSSGMRSDMVSHAEGRFTIVTDGEILTNNSEDGPSASPAGREVHWDVSASSKKIPEALIRL